ncbi:hypothetical protein C8R47DRAFT_1133019 [Mycena vitilis]|nr:hypothetical protein C8R47DRAFT_1133019 [Mycena vitilis]
MDPLTPGSFFELDAYVHVACITLLIYDTVLNLDVERRHIWKTKWGVVKCLYLWTRYGAFIDTAMALEKRVNLHTDQSSCRIFTDFDTIFGGLGIAVAEVIMMIRTYALYGGSRKLVVFFATMMLVMGGVNIWAAILWTNSASPPTHKGVLAVVECDSDGSSNIGLVCYISLLVGETVVVLLTVWKCFSALSSFSGASGSFRLINSFYRDATFSRDFAQPLIGREVWSSQWASKKNLG